LHGRLTRTGQAGSVPPGKQTGCLGRADEERGGVGGVGSVRSSGYVLMSEFDGTENMKRDIRWMPEATGRNGDVQLRFRSGGNGKSGAESGSVQPLQPHLPL
jgi:hypothetical protein